MLPRHAIHFCAARLGRSAADSRILRDVVSRRHGLKVPRGFYYLFYAGYPNREGFLAPYRGQRYHLNDWRTGHQPMTPQEFFNMKHSSARNVIERSFVLLKRRMASSGRDNELTSGNSSGRMVKHQWTPQEDDKLVENLYELYTIGTWKCDTGFKSGYLVQLEKNDGCEDAYRRG
ncbi:hypothetical protein L1049_028322 [Liquidambar formosana]|uniref:DDE Tnp4 domain-containing protein n=1 Tax=Liquidambar formosana TaxID=63359 RepID=A0AAP0RMA4_LIQFO